jgi:hypothetical protein
MDGDTKLDPSFDAVDKVSSELQWGLMKGLENNNDDIALNIKLKKER